MSTENISEKSRKGITRIRQLLTSNRFFPYILLLPVAVWVLAVFLYPLAQTVWFSFTNTGLIESGQFIGLQNYRELLTGEFVATIWRTAIWTFGAVIPAILIGLVGALVMNQEFRGRRIFMGLILIPWTVPLAIVGFLWLMMYNPQFGMLNVILESLNLSSVSFLNQENALISVIVARIWRATPFALVTYYARLKSIPPELYDAAKMDGAGVLAQFRYVTFPELTRITALNLIILTVWTTLIFDIIFTMTGGGPINSTTIIPISIYRTTFSAFNLGLAAAQSMITVVFLVLVTIVYWRMTDISE